MPRNKSTRASCARSKTPVGLNLVASECEYCDGLFFFLRLPRHTVRLKLCPPCRADAHADEECRAYDEKLLELGKVREADYYHEP